MREVILERSSARVPERALEPIGDPRKQGAQPAFAGLGAVLPGAVDVILALRGYFGRKLHGARVNVAVALVHGEAVLEVHDSVSSVYGAMHIKQYRLATGKIK